MPKADNSLLLTLLFFISIVLCVVIRLHSLGAPLPIDLTAHSYMAHRLLAGDELYTNIWNHKPPGVYWAYMLAELIWGYGVAASVYIGIVFTVLTQIFIYLFTKKIAGRPAALLASIFWALSSNALFMEASQPNVEPFMNAFTMAALWSFLKFRDGSRAFILLSGLLLTVASVFKTVALFPFLALFAYMIWRAVSEDRAGWLKKNLSTWILYLIPGAVIWALLALYFVSVGRFPDFWEAVFQYNTQYSGNILYNFWFMLATPSLLASIAFREAWVLVILALAWLPYSRKEYGPVSRSFFLFLLLGIAVEVAAPGKYYNHYYQLYLPLLSILASLFIVDLSGYLQEKHPGRAKAVTVLVIVFATANLAYYQGKFLYQSPEDNSREIYGEQYIEVRELGKYIKSVTEPCETIYTWGEQTGIYYYSQRKATSGTFFIYSLFFDQDEMKKERLRKVYAELRATPPALFIVEEPHRRYLDRNILSFIVSNYDVRERFRDNYTIYELKKRRPCG